MYYNVLEVKKMNFFIYDAESLKRKLHLEVNEDISVDDILKERKVKEL